MRVAAQALFVHDQNDPWGELKHLLERLGFEVLCARSCAEAEKSVSGAKLPVLIFTDPVLTDGTWVDVKALAEGVRPVVPVIVVSRLMDLPLYLEVLESGASDFLVPPFQKDDLDDVVKSALLNRSRISPRLPRPSTTTHWEMTHHAQNHSGSGG